MTPTSHWGDESWISSICESAGLAVEGHRRMENTWSFRDAEAATDFFITTAPPIAAARDRLERDGRFSELASAIRGVVDECGQEVDGSFEIAGGYLLTRAVAS
jgi:hypothetical protein